MKARAFLLLLTVSLVSLGSLWGATRQDDLKAIAVDLCQAAVGDIHSYDLAGIRPIFDERMARLLGRAPDDHSDPRIDGLRRVAWEFVEAQERAGLAVVYAANNAVGNLDMCRVHDLTPERFTAFLVQRKREAVYVERIPGTGFARTSLKQLGIEASSGPIRSLLDNFDRDPVPIFVADEAGLIWLYTRIMPVSMDFLIAPGATEVPQPVAEATYNGFYSELAATGASFQHGHIDKPVVWKSRYMHSPSARGQVVHELGHVVQYNRWDLLRVLDHFITHILPQIPDRRAEIDEALAPRGPLALLFSGFRVNFTNTADRKYYESILEEGTRRGLGHLEWLIFYDYLRFIKELDSHLWESAWYDHAGLLKPHSLDNHAMFDHIRITYWQAGQLLRPSIALFSHKRDEINALREALNDPKNARP